MDLLALTLAVICTNDLVNNERRHFAFFVWGKLDWIGYRKCVYMRYQDLEI